MLMYTTNVGPRNPLKRMLGSAPFQTQHSLVVRYVSVFSTGQQLETISFELLMDDGVGGIWVVASRPNLLKYRFSY